MPIYKLSKRDIYVCLDKSSINDSNLSYKAKGILIYLLSKPNDWIVRESDIIAHSKDGRESVRSGIKELIDAGYITKHQPKNEYGQFEEVTYNVFETSTTSKTPSTENLSTDNLSTENQTLLNNNILSNDLTNNKKKNKDTLLKIPFAEFVKLTESEYQKLIDKYGEVFTKACIEKLDNYKGASGKKYTSDYRAILTWVADDISKKINPSKKIAKPPEIIYGDYDEAIRKIQEEHKKKPKAQIEIVGIDM